MQEVIRDGALRLMTSEATCDVILNCQGHRLMAHKVMLSIASPLLQVSIMSYPSLKSLILHRVLIEHLNLPIIRM